MNNIDSPTSQNQYNPIKFFSLVLLISWSMWITAATISQTSSAGALDGRVAPFLTIGLLGPVLSAVICLFGSHNRDLRADVKHTNQCISKWTFRGGHGTMEYA